MRALGLWLLLLLTSTSALAQMVPYKRTPVPDREPGQELCVTWNRRDLTWYADQAGSARTPGEAEFVALEAAFQSWQAVSDNCSDFRFTQGPRQANVQVGKGSQDTNVVVFRETNCREAVPPTDPCLADGSCANKIHCWDHNDLTIALTTVTYSTRTGLIYDADIELNASPHGDGSSFLFTTISSPACMPGAESPQCVATDIQNTMTHEVGHLVGLDHVEVTGSLMEPTAPLGEVTKRVIDRGTADGFCTTYPRGQPPLPCNVLAQSQRRITARSLGTVGLAGCGCGTPSGPLLALALGVLVTKWRHGRQKSC